MKIIVTQADIAKARRKGAAYCPIEYAIKRTTTSKTVLRDWLEPDLFKLPLVAERFIDSFDFDCHVKPFTFTLKRR